MTRRASERGENVVIDWTLAVLLLNSTTRYTQRKFSVIEVVFAFAGEDRFFLGEKAN